MANRIIGLTTAIAISFLSITSAQVNFTSDAITFRTSSNQTPRTTHYGNLDIFGSGTTGSVLSVENTYVGSLSRVAIYGYSAPQPGAGIGIKGCGGLRGVQGYAWESATSGIHYGGYFTATNAPTNYGIYASAANGINNYAAYFSGSTYCTGAYLPSDEKLKENVEDMDNSLTKVLKLNPKKYDYKIKEFAQMNLPKGKRFGLIAQDVETVFPELITEITEPDTSEIPEPNKKLNTFKAVDYVSLIPILVQAIKEQQQEINDLRRIVETKCNK